MEFYNEGNSLFVQELYEDAEAEYTKAIEAEQNIEFYIARSNCRMKLDRYEDAYKDSIQAIKINPIDPMAFFRKGYELCFYIIAKQASDQVNLKQQRKHLFSYKIMEKNHLKNKLNNGFENVMQKSIVYYYLQLYINMYR